MSGSETKIKITADFMALMQDAPSAAASFSDAMTNIRSAGTNTADVITSQLAKMSTELANMQQRAASASGAMRESLDAESAAYQRVIQDLGQLKSLLDQQAAAATSAAAANTKAADAAKAAGDANKDAEPKVRSHSSAVQELTRMVRALISGNLTVLPGELMTLTTRMDGLSTGIMGTVGAMAVFAAGAVAFVDWILKIRTAQEGAQTAAAMYNPGITRDQATAIEERLRTVYKVSTEVAQQASVVAISMKGSSKATADFLVDSAALAAQAGGDLTESLRRSAEAYADPSRAGREFMATLAASKDEVRDGKTALQLYNDALLGSNAVVDARVILLETMKRVDDSISKNAVDAAMRTARADDMVTAARMAGLDGMGQALQLSGDLSQAGALETSRQRNYAAALGAVNSEQHENIRQLQTLIAAKRAEAAAAAEAARVEEQARPSSTATTQNRAALEAELRVYQEALTARGLHEHDMTALTAASLEVQKQLTRQTTQDEMQAAQEWLRSAESAYVRDKAAFVESLQGKVSSSREASIKTAEWDEKYWRDRAASIASDGKMSAQLRAAEEKADQARLALARTRIAEISSATSKSLKDRIAELNTEQAAAGTNFQQVMELEQQKLAMIRAAVDEKDKLYQDELRHEIELQNRHTRELVAIEQAHLTAIEQENAKDLQAFRSTQEAKLSAHEITYDQMIASLRVFESTQSGLLLADLDRFLRAQDQKTRAAAATTDTVYKLNKDLSAKLAKLDQEQAAHDKQILDSKIQMWESAAGTIGGSMKSALSGIITGQTTMQKAVRSVTSSMLSEFISMASTMAARWLVLKTTQVVVNGATNAVISAQDKASETGFFTMAEALLAKWGIMETGKTAATSTGIATRQTMDEADMVASKASHAAFNMAQIEANAAKAASGAYAAIAEIPLVGPVLAPAAAAVAYSGVMAYGAMASLAVGTPNVPRDMVANIHQGEMIVPKNFAEGIRSGQVSLGGGSQGGGGDNHYHFSPSVTAAQGASPGSSVEQQVMSAYHYFRNVGRNGALTLPGRSLR